MALALHHVVEGQGPVVVLGHALGCDLGMWDEVAARLRERFTVVRYDQRGHGRSPAPGGAFGIEALADDAAGLIDSLRCGPVHFVGLSMGGMAGQALAVRRPELLRTLVIANSAAFYDAAARAMWQARIDTVRAQGMAAIVDGALERWFTPAFRTDAARGAARVQALRGTLERCDAGAYVRACEAVAGIDFRATNPRIACPTLVIAGTLDEATPPAMAEAIRESIPQARLASIAAAHLSAVEDPQGFVGLLEGFWGG